MSCSALLEKIISSDSTAMAASLCGVIWTTSSASWRTGIGWPSATKPALAADATKPGALMTPLPSKASTVTRFNNSAPADAGPSASSASRTTVCDSSAAHPAALTIAGTEALRRTSCVRRSLGHISAATSPGERRL